MVSFYVDMHRIASELRSPPAYSATPDNLAGCKKDKGKENEKNGP